VLAVTGARQAAKRAGIMGALRNFLAARRGMAFAVIVLALAIKALVPAGFMIETGNRVLTFAICADASGDHAFSREIVIPAKQVERGSSKSKSGEGCSFAGHSAAGVSGADPVLLALALAFIALLGFLPVTLPLITPGRRIRPPLRAPPVFS